MKAFAVAGLVLVALSGCLGDEGTDREAAVCDGFDCDLAPPVCMTDGCGSGDAANATVAPPPLTEPFVLDGDVGQGLTVCEYSTANTCRSVEAAAYEGGILVAANGTILGGTATLTWSPGSPVHEDLGFGIMTMTAGCRECHRANLGEATGRSPLTIELSPVDFVLQAEEKVHVYVYALTYREAGPVGAELDAGQPFHVEGNVTYQPWVEPAG